MAPKPQAKSLVGSNRLLLPTTYINPDRLKTLLDKRFPEGYKIQISRDQYQITTVNALTSDDVREIKNLRFTKPDEGADKKEDD
ncbi:hypothetical protein GGR51DRAFT_556941 [Nemania sp. FL0031]|nr:hypothetical protein GGR51DRAFT_556941 [Nemania sp. FL0031]